MIKKQGTNDKQTKPYQNRPLVGDGDDSSPDFTILYYFYMMAS